MSWVLPIFKYERIHDLLTTKMRLILPELPEMYIKLRLKFAAESQNIWLQK